MVAFHREWGNGVVSTCIYVQLGFRITVGRMEIERARNGRNHLENGGLARGTFPVGK